jgi:hypothetical protein
MSLSVTPYWDSTLREATNITILLIYRYPLTQRLHKVVVRC